MNSPNNKLLAAVHSGDVNEVRAQLQAGADINCQDRFGDTPLMIASCNGSTDIVHLLLKSGANINFISQKTGKSALQQACSRGKTHIAEILLLAGADYTIRYMNPSSHLHNKTPLECCTDAAARAVLEALAHALRGGAGAGAGTAGAGAALAPAVPPTVAPAPTPAVAAAPAPVEVPAPPPRDGALTAQLQMQVQALVTERDTSRADLEQAQQQIIALQRQVVDAVADRDQAVLERNDARFERDQAQQQIIALQRQVVDLVADRDQVVLERNDARIERDQARQQLEDVTAQRNELADLATESPFCRYQPHLLTPGVIHQHDTGVLGGFQAGNGAPLFRFCHALCDTGGCWAQGDHRPVAGFRLDAVQPVRNAAHRVQGFTACQTDMNARRQTAAGSGGKYFNYDSLSFTDEQYRTLSILRSQFHEKPPGTSNLSVNTVYCYHGPVRDNLMSVCQNGLAAVRDRDAGFFGAGSYTTLNIEYALQFAYGQHDADFNARGPRPSPDGRYPVIMFAATVGMAYPVTPAVDYNKVPGSPDGFSDFFGRPLKKRFDCHVVCVNKASGFQAVNRADCEYVELVFFQEAQILPVAVLWFARN